MRNKLKTALLFLVIFILGNVLASSVAIHQSMSRLEDSVKARLGTAVILDFDSDALIMQMESGTIPEPEEIVIPYTEETIRTFGESRYVKYYENQMGLTLGSKSLKNVPSETHIQLEEEAQLFGFSVMGTRIPEVLIIEEGKAELLQGRTFRPEEIEEGHSVVLITRQLAERNQLGVGDEISLTNYIAEIPLPEYITGEQDLAPLEVIGIYEYLPIPSLDFLQTQGRFYYEDPVDNNLIVPEPLIMKEIKLRFGDQLLFGETFFVMNSPDDVAGFLEEFTSQLPTGYLFRSNAQLYSNIKAPLEQVSRMADSILYFSIGASVLILGLVVLFFLHDRRRELGILLSLGEKRHRTMVQILSEVLIVATLALLLSVFTGQMVAQTISESIIQDEIAADVDYGADQDFWRNRYHLGRFAESLSPEVIRANYRLDFSYHYLLTFGVMSFVAIFMAAVIPILYLSRLNPKSILMSS